MKRFLTVLLVAGAMAGAVWLWRSGALELPGDEDEERRAKEPVVFENVQLRVFDDTGEAQVDVFSESVHTDKHVNELSFEPVRAVFYQDGKETATLTAKQGQKKVRARKERVDFSGDVRVTSRRPAELLTEQLRYFPREGLLEAPVRARVLTTSTTIVGDSIQSDVNLKRGVVRGNVEIVSNEGFGSAP